MNPERNRIDSQNEVGIAQKTKIVLSTLKRIILLFDPRPKIEQTNVVDSRQRDNPFC